MRRVMRHNRNAGRGFLACVLAVILAIPGTALAVTNQDAEEAREQVSSMEDEKEKVEETLKNLESLKNDTAAYVRELDTSLESLGEEISNLQQQRAAKEEEIAVTQGELEEAQEMERQQYESMKLRIQYMYERGETSYFDILMQSENIADMLNRAEYISQISEYDRNQLDAYARTKEQIAQKETELEAEHANLVALQEDLEAKHASVETLLANKQQELANYEAKIASAENEISEYEKDIALQEAKIKEIEEEIRRQEEEARKKAQEAGTTYKTTSLGDINFIWPCPSSSRITSGFGGRSSPTEGASSNHKGIDIGASTGSDILAAAGGTVTISTYSSSAGNYMMISHGGGVYTVYMHCSQRLVEVGDSVSQGQVIGKVGSTGYSTGPHLHFEIRSGGSNVNPSLYVSP